MLHKSHFYKEDIVKYCKCKKCESTRLPKHRNAARYVEVDGCCSYCCPSCRKAIDMEKVYDVPGDGKCSFYDCCCGAQNRLRHKKGADSTPGQRYHPAQTKCEWCYNFSCNANSACLKRRSLCRGKEEPLSYTCDRQLV